MRRSPATGSNTTNERETAVNPHYVSMAVHRDRQREIERRLQFGPRAFDRPPSPSIRRRVGVELIRIGSSLACDEPLQLAARR
jgi:hypothetical protein